MVRVRIVLSVFGCVALLSISAICSAEALAMDEAPARPGEWGFRPADGGVSPVDPPGFVWRPQAGATGYELECARDRAFRRDVYRAAEIDYNCHCPPKTFGKGTWYWRFRVIDKAGRKSAWSKTRSFHIDAGAVGFPMPTREELIQRIPKEHPRLFIRPTQLPHLRKLAAGELKAARDRLVAECDKLLKRPPPTKEPPKYPRGMLRKSEDWRRMWWGNRTYTIKLLNGAATLAFTRLLTGDDEYGRLAKRLLLAAAEWDPKGATGYRYNDEAGMPYNYYFSRTYTFVHDLLDDEQRARCRRVMQIRGRQMYQHLAPRHLWRPYSSHSNRAWHFLGEIGVAFLDEIPEAAEWVWFAMNVFYNAYPVWSDDEGGWHEGVSYWSSYIGRFTWWADVMRTAMGVNAYKKPYFSQVGDYAMYLQPPGTRGGGFGDLTARRTSRHNRGLMTILAAQARNPYWQWYVDKHGGPQQTGGYVGFVRGALPNVAARKPDKLPTSRCFRGTGLAMLNTDLASAADNVQVHFKASPFGTQSHGYESNNSILLYAFGERLLIRTGRRDIYGSKHHVRWMWHTKSTNCITVNGISQVGHSAAAQGRILGFHTGSSFDYVAGDAAGAYPKGAREQFTRHILFIKPELIVIYDVLRAPKRSTFEWHLHSPTKMSVAGQHNIRVTTGRAACRVAMLAPADLKLSLTDKFDPPPRARIKLVEWHLTAGTPATAERMEFVTVIRPYRVGSAPPAAADSLEEIDGGYALTAKLADGSALVLLRARDKGAIAHSGHRADADLAAVRFDANGKALANLRAVGPEVHPGRGALK